MSASLAGGSLAGDEISWLNSKSLPTLAAPNLGAGPRRRLVGEERSKDRRRNQPGGASKQRKSF
jgi:hypothetical protein